MSDPTRHDQRGPDESSPKRDLGGAKGPGHASADPLVLLDECLASLPEDDPRQKLLYKIRHHLLQETTSVQQREAELKKLQDVVGKLTAPANRIGTLLELPEQGLARIMVGGAEYFSNLDPRVDPAELKIGAQVLVNEAFAVIRSLGYDRHGPVLRIGDTLPDGRLRVEQEGGRQGLILSRSSDLADVEIKPGEEVRVDPQHRIAVERLESQRGEGHVLDEIPTVTWEQIGGQASAITAIRKAIEDPLLHAETFHQFQFSQPKGFLLHGPPGCGKTLLGQATAASLAKALEQRQGGSPEKPNVTKGLFLHVKGPEILNMWLGESERIVRDLFAQARARRQEGAFPVIFIDEAESILGTRRAMRSFNITNTLVPMFCSEMDGIESLQDVVIILASNRPDLIDPAVLRPGRIDRKIKVTRPGRNEAHDILRIYLKPDLPLDAGLLRLHDDVRAAACEDVIHQTVEAIFAKSEDHRLISIRLRNGKNKVLYRSDLVSGAILASIVQRAKEKAIDRMLERPEGERAGQGLTPGDLQEAVQAEYREGELLPPDDAAEEWLKLLDHHPDQVVGISPFRKGRVGEERVLGNII